MPQPHPPLIGLTSGIAQNQAGGAVCQLGQAYITAIERAGGIPLVIPAGKESFDPSILLARLDGLVLTGGGDLDPERFGGTPHPKVYGISPERDTLELALVQSALAADKPLLAICRGIQVLNVACGGSLFTHIQDQLPNALKHDWFPKFPRDKFAHSVRLEPNSQIRAIFNTDEIQVNSLHHQGISRIGAGLHATAFAPDTLVEALEVQGTHFALGVQWHPECLPEDMGMQKLFRAFIKACDQPSL